MCPASGVISLLPKRTSGTWFDGMLFLNRDSVVPLPVLLFMWLCFERDLETDLDPLADFLPGIFSGSLICF